MLKISKVEGKGVTYATPGIGTTPHMAGELLRETQGANLTQVPYKGSGPATADVISGQVDVGFMSITAAATFLKENRLQGLATSGTARSTVLPDLPKLPNPATACCSGPGCSFPRRCLTRFSNHWPPRCRPFMRIRPTQKGSPAWVKPRWGPSWPIPGNTSTLNTANGQR